MAKVMRIEAHIPALKKKKRVAAYARVSMETDNLLHSLSAQVSYYSDLIQNNPEWEYAGVYADQGITGTKVDGRHEFLRLVSDCDAGKIDIVIVKSISRFARDTVDTLKTVRHLKDIGVEVRFERENISTLSADGELMLTILASYAQEESRSISENVKWGTRKRFEQGIPNGHKAPFGYYWDGEIYKAIPAQADAVRIIFEMYLAGYTPFQIRDEMREEGIKGQSGAEMEDWTIKDILSNISYTGRMILQKNYINDAHRRVRNKGELPRYVVEDMYEPIITDEQYERAQEIRKSRAAEFEKDIHLTCFSGRMRCGCCKSAMSRRTANHKKKWVCNRRERKNACDLKPIWESDLIEAATEALGGVLNEDDFRHMVSMVEVYDDRVVFIFDNGKELIKMRSYAGKRRGAFSGRLFCGVCGQPCHRESIVESHDGVREKHIYRRCKSEKRHGCNLKMLSEADLLTACKDVLNESDPERAFARDIRRLDIYDNRLEFVSKTGEKTIWLRR